MRAKYKSWNHEYSLDRTQVMESWIQFGQNTIHGIMNTIWTEHNTWNHEYSLDKTHVMESCIQSGQNKIHGIMNTVWTKHKSWNHVYNFDKHKSWNRKYSLDKTQVMRSDIQFWQNTSHEIMNDIRTKHESDLLFGHLSLSVGKGVGNEKEVKWNCGRYLKGRIPGRRRSKPAKLSSDLASTVFK